MWRPKGVRISLISGLFIILLFTPMLVFAQGGLVAHWNLDEMSGTTTIDSANGSQISQ